MKNATIQLKGNATINGAKNASTYYLGGLSGEATSALWGFNVKQKGEGTWVVGTANTNETFHGVINNNDQAGTHPGTTSIEKQGSGDWRLMGKNDYNGTTTVTSGRLIVNGQHTGKGSITVRKGAILAGKGSLTGVTTINDGGILQVGDTLANDKGLTFNGGLKLNSGAILRLNDVTMETDFKAGDLIKVFTGKATGEFADIQPATPGEGLVWDTSELYTSGLLKVATSSSISIIRAEKENDGIVYDLGGHRYTKAGKGIAIQGGRKIQVKR